MSQLKSRPNKKSEARQIAGDLLKDYDYIYNPSDDTYQLAHKETGELYTGSMGGLDADKGLFQRDRKLKRLIGDQLSHQRHIAPKTVSKTSTLVSKPSGEPKVEPTVREKEDKTIIEEKPKQKGLTEDQLKQIQKQQKADSEERKKELIAKGKKDLEKPKKEPETLLEMFGVYEPTKEEIIEEMMEGFNPESLTLVNEPDATRVDNKYKHLAGKMSVGFKKSGGQLVKKYQTGNKFNPSVLDPNDEVVFGTQPQLKKLKPKVGIDVEQPTAELKPVKQYSPEEQKEMVKQAKKDRLKDTIGSFELSSKPGTFSGDTRSIVEKGMDYVTPVAGVADYLIQNNALNKLAGKKVPRTYDTPARLNVRAVEDLPYEVLVARENEINRMRSDYKGSDPVAELVSKHMIEVEKGKARERLGAERAAHIATEKSRVDEMNMKNQLLSQKTAEKNFDLQRQYEQADLANEIDIINRKADLKGQGLALLSKGVENRLNTRDLSELKSKDVALKRIQSELALQEAIVRDTDATDPAGKQAVMQAQQKIKELAQEQSNLLGEVQGKYTRLSNDATFGIKKTGGKLISRK